MNWPESGYSDRTELASWQSIYAYAITYAKRKKFYTDHFQVYLRYSKARDKIVWLFQFPVRDISKETLLRTFEIDWLGARLLKDYMENY